DIDPHTATLVPERIARRHSAIPIGMEEGKLVLAMANPLDIHAVDDIRVITGYEIKPVVATESEVLKCINQYLRVSVEAALQTAEAEVRERPKEEVKIVAEEAPMAKLADQIISQAVSQGASDIHLEPQENEMKVRYRVDGVLHEAMSIPKKLIPGLTSRVKIMCEMDITEHRIPQDGRYGTIVLGKEIDLRVATLPSIYGENITTRILDKSQALLKLEQFGFTSEMHEKYRSSYTKPYGTILVTGPTGSGKSTTLYATLNVLNSPEKKIITVEDPVEYRLPGVTQIQANTKVGLTFARGLRSIVRSDPDIIMIGEIRDLETAQIAVESALTGHLVLSTLHTNDAPSALTRLTEMGVEPFLISSALDCVLAQRLARRLCEECKESYVPDSKIIEENFPQISGEVTLYRAKGCKRCLNPGYRGRLGLYELMLVTDRIGKMCVERKSSEEIKTIAIEEGMKTLKDDGLLKAMKGLTSLEEVLRVVA
ncbi:MAG: GspE/PulE family protein, partial [Candidatus Subteraquimicrobiales bacterium]|nr:GspE/PulE family protein [Candidatus Subteraquimicrobiales bacterium]